MKTKFTLYTFGGGRRGSFRLPAGFDYFTARAVNERGKKLLDLSARIIAAERIAQITDADGKKTDLPQGSAVLIPASMPRITVRGNCNIITTYIK